MKGELLSKEDEEYILCAAIHFDDNTLHSHQPKNILTGLVVCGRRHHNCFALLSALDVNRLDFDSCIQGFLTSHDRFLNRKESADLALKMNQIDKATEMLFSEDLY